MGVRWSDNAREVLRWSSRSGYDVVIYGSECDGSGTYLLPQLLGHIFLWSPSAIRIARLTTMSTYDTIIQSSEFHPHITLLYHLLSFPDLCSRSTPPTAHRSSCFPILTCRYRRALGCRSGGFRWIISMSGKHRVGISVGIEQIREKGSMVWADGVSMWCGTAIGQDLTYERL